MIKIENLNKTYKSKKGIDTLALKDVNLSFNDSGFVFIVGKSGSGKSTLLNLIGALDSPDSGKIVVDNSDICLLSKSESDSYRNTYVGFVFQEFNLLEEFNVFENINIALKLNKTNDENRVEKVLKSVDLEGLGSRNINELSGGQKQRVSIARAIVKKPKLILADEPTGNLDKKSSEQILEILKDLSKDHLVIIVSHDIEAARKYADRIIRIEDGCVVEDKKNKVKESNKKLKFNQSKLPFSYLFKIAYSYTMSKPVRLVLTILLTMLSLSFMCFAINAYLFDNTSLLINTMHDNHEYNLKIEHYNVEIENDIRKEERLSFNDYDINYVENVTNSKANKAYILYNNGDKLRFVFGVLPEELEENDAYNVIPGSFRFIVINDKYIVSKVLGHSPVNDNEILVHKYFADTMINAGIYDSNHELYKPKTYDEIIDSKHELLLGNNSVVISGIIDDDTSLYTRAFKYGTFWNENLKKHYRENYSSYGSVIYVTEGFVENIDLNNDINLSKISLSYNDIVSNKSINILDKKISYIDLNGNLVETDKLNDNEIIISEENLGLFENSYKNNLDQYIRSHSNMVYNDILTSYIQLYLQNNRINKNITLINNSNDVTTTNNYLIVGVSLTGNYVSNYFERNDLQKIIDYLVVYTYRDEDMKNVFDTLDVQFTYNYFKPGDKYRVSYDNSSNVSSVIYVYSRIKKYLLVTSLIFVLFSLLLIFNFISVSIESFKKQIGILRSIGTRNVDVIKIFIIETLLIGLISWLFGTIIWIISCIVMNNQIFGGLYFTLNGIIIKPLSCIIVLVFDIVISLMLTISLINKINKIKPIEVILNKY